MVCSDSLHDKGCGAQLTCFGTNHSFWDFSLIGSWKNSAPRKLIKVSDDATTSALSFCNFSMHTNGAVINNTSHPYWRIRLFRSGQGCSSFPLHTPAPRQWGQVTQASPGFKPFCFCVCGGCLWCQSAWLVEEMVHNKSLMLPIRRSPICLPVQYLPGNWCPLP